MLAELVGVQEAAAVVQRVDGGHVVDAQLKVEDLHVLLDAAGRHRLGDDDVAALQLVPDLTDC